ncbi:hypothetical protein D3OALGA1CA_3176 [Olavius algarvensis associated proteobacterium Delta 3]|nr:hypothetical protein D3OALGA1CA_3176 [Olavius algarvensis associated proteobacterium Delta 3]
MPGIQDSSGKIQGGYRSDGYGCKMQDTRYKGLGIWNT